MKLENIYIKSISIQDLQETYKIKFGQSDNDLTTFGYIQFSNGSFEISTDLPEAEIFLEKFRNKQPLTITIE